MTQSSFTDSLFDGARDRIMARLNQLYPGQFDSRDPRVFEAIRNEITNTLYKANPTSSINWARLNAETYVDQNGNTVVPDARTFLSELKKLGLHYQELGTSEIPNGRPPFGQGGMAQGFLNTVAGQDIAQVLDQVLQSPELRNNPAAAQAIMRSGNIHMVVMTELYRELQTQVRDQRFVFLGPRDVRPGEIQSLAEGALNAIPQRDFRDNPTHYRSDDFQGFRYRLYDSSRNFGNIDGFFNRDSNRYYYAALDADIAFAAERRQQRPLPRLQEALGWGEAGTLPEFQGGGPTGRFNQSAYRFGLYEGAWGDPTGVAGNPTWNVNEWPIVPRPVRVPEWWGETVRRAAAQEAGIPLPPPARDQRERMGRPQ